MRPPQSGFVQTGFSEMRAASMAGQLGPKPNGGLADALLRLIGRYTNVTRTVGAAGRYEDAI